jgi:hypothetical protein
MDLFNLVKVVFKKQDLPVNSLSVTYSQLFIGSIHVLSGFLLAMGGFIKDDISCPSFMTEPLFPHQDLRGFCKAQYSLYTIIQGQSQNEIIRNTRTSLNQVDTAGRVVGFYHGNYFFLKWCILISGVVVLLPRLIWKWLDGGLFGNLLRPLKDESVNIDSKIRQRNCVIRFMCQTELEVHRFVNKYLMCEFLTFSSTIVAFVLITTSVGSFTYGVGYFGWHSDIPHAGNHSVQDILFPSTATCFSNASPTMNSMTWKDRGLLFASHLHPGQFFDATYLSGGGATTFCTLPLNWFYRYFFLLSW